MKAIIFNSNNKVVHKAEGFTDLEAVARWATIQGVVGHQFHSTENFFAYGKGSHLMTNDWQLAPKKATLLSVSMACRL